MRLGEVPLLLHFWGGELYGEWLMLAAIPAYLAMGDGGFGAAATREMGMRSSAGDRAGALTVFQSTAVVLSAASLLLAVIAAGLVHFAPLGHWLGFHRIAESELDWVLLLLTGHVVIGFYGGLMNGGFWSSGSYPLGMALATSTQLLEFAALAVVVICGGGPVQAAAAYLLGRCFGTAGTWAILARRSPWLRAGLTGVSWREIRRLIKPALASLAFPLGNALNIQGMRILIGMAMGPAAVAVFSPLRTLSTVAAQPVQVINKLIQPELAIAYGRADRGLVVRLFFRGSQAAVWLCTAAVACLLLSAPYVVPVWTGESLDPHGGLLALMLAGAWINSLWVAALMVPFATNRHGRIAVIYVLAYGVLPLATAQVALAGNRLEVAGLALVAAESVMAWYVIRAALAMTGQHWPAWIRGMLPLPGRWAVHK